MDIGCEPRERTILLAQQDRLELGRARFSRRRFAAGIETIRQEIAIGHSRQPRRRRRLPQGEGRRAQGKASATDPFDGLIRCSKVEGSVTVVKHAFTAWIKFDRQKGGARGGSGRSLDRDDEQPRIGEQRPAVRLRRIGVLAARSR